MAKRLFDILLALLLMILLLPLIGLLSLFVWATLGPPVLFAQQRAGLGGRTFRMRKFRSMLNTRGADGQLLPDEQRLTQSGRLLRRTRLDELPELWFILTGRLSFVGPRPLPLAIIEAEPLGPRRLAVRPGLTGLAQVSGNTLLSNREKFALDAYYVDHRSFWGDAAILLRTATTVIAGERRDEAMITEAVRHADGIDRRG